MTDEAKSIELTDAQLAKILGILDRVEPEVANRAVAEIRATLDREESEREIVRLVLMTLLKFGIAAIG